MLLAIVAAARWLHFCAAMILFGSSLFALYARAPAPARAKAEASSSLLPLLSRWAAVAALLSALVWVAGTIVMITDDPNSLFDLGVLSDFFFGTPFGVAWIVGFVLLVAIVVTAFLRPPRWSQMPPAWIAVLAGLLLVSQAWIGHAGAGEGREAWLEIVGYGVHVLAAGAWLGALPMLTGFLVVARRHPDASEAARMQVVLSRFSLMGIIAVSLVLLSGVANSWFRLASLNDLVATPYGKLIIAKFLLLCCLVVIAAQNRVRLMPRLGRAGGESAADALRLLVRNVYLEQIGGALVLALAAVLGLLSPSG